VEEKEEEEDKTYKEVTSSVYSMIL